MVRVNGRVERLAGDCRLAALLLRLGYAGVGSGIAVALNGVIVPRAEWTARVLQPGDAIDVVGAVAGG